MNILITNQSLSQRTGTELIVTELALAFVRRGHRVAAFSSRLGETAELLREAAVPVIDTPESCPFVPDIIHGQHHLDAMAAVLAFPQSPAIFYCHGGYPWLERPPQHPRILRHAAMCDVLADLLAVEHNLDPGRILTIPNWVDLLRFPNVRILPPQPANALIFHSLLPHHRHGEIIRQACAACGIAVDLSIDWTPEQQKCPGDQLLQYDIAFAAGRSALEALAAGCAVVPVSAEASLHWVWPENFTHLRGQNFSPRQHDAKMSASVIGEILARYDAAKSAAATAMVRNTCTLEHAADQLLELYQQVIIEWKNSAAPDPDAERRALLKYLRGLAPAVRDVESLPLRHERQITQKDAAIQELKQQLAKTQPAAKTVAALRKSIIGRLALSRAKRQNGAASD
jgi:hypothetical protein